MQHSFSNRSRHDNTEGYVYKFCSKGGIQPLSYTLTKCTTIKLCSFLTNWYHNMCFAHAVCGLLSQRIALWNMPTTPDSCFANPISMWWKQATQNIQSGDHCENMTLASDRIYWVYTHSCHGTLPVCSHNNKLQVRYFGI